MMLEQSLRDIAGKVMLMLNYIHKSYREKAS